MNSSMSRLLVLNSGSSSLKYALFNIVENVVKSVCASGVVEKIGEHSQNVKLSYLNEDTSMESVKHVETDLITHKQALQHVLSLLEEISCCSLSNGRLGSVGHRVVHGGENLTKAQLINANILKSIEESSVLAPLHNPSNIAGIRTAMEIFPSTVPQVAVFDTAFHSAIPKYAYLYGLPYHLYEKFGIRKYGFHGTSHEYIMKEASIFLNKSAKSLNLITCHLGAGSSISCIKNGCSVDTSMGMTPMAGLLMQTRCGDIDPGVIFYLMNTLKMSGDEVEKLLLEESGWFGMSGYKDARELEDAFEMGDERAVTALQSVVHRIKSYLGSYYWHLNGEVDAVVFTAGVGENWPALREMCFGDSRNLGFEIDRMKNGKARHIDQPVEISSKQSKHKILVIPTNEERSIASKTLEVLNTSASF